MTNDSDKFNQGEFSGQNYPLFEGRMINQYDHQFREYKSGTGRTAVWEELPFSAKRIRPQFFINKKAIDERRSSFPNSYRAAFGAVSSATNERTVQATVIPRNAVCNHSLVTVWFHESQHAKTLVWVCVANSVVFDWCVRLRASLNLTFSLMFDMPFPSIDEKNKSYRYLSHRAARLICVTPEMKDLWNELVIELDSNSLPQWDPLLTAISLGRRAKIRAEIDALIADLYGLGENDFAYILTTFPLLDRDMPALPGEPKSTITRDLALLALFRLRRQPPPPDIVPFFAAAGADVSAITGPIRTLETRVHEACKLGAVAYIPSGRGAPVAPEEALRQLNLFTER